MNRRAFLKAGATMSVLLLSRPSWSAEGIKSKLSDQEILTGAGDRIEKHRKGDTVIAVKDANDKPVRGARIRIEQLRHEFLFGCNFFMFNRCGDPVLEEAYRSRFTALLNYCTLGFYWSSYEPARGTPNYEYSDRAVAFARDHGMICKGHPLVWDHPAGSPAWLPDDHAEIGTLSNQRVKDIVARFKGRIDIWDVVNEATHLEERGNKTRMAEWGHALGAHKYVSEPLKTARAANPAATLIVNDYRTDPKFLKILEGLREDGRLPFDVVGIQSHMHGGAWPLQKVWDICDTYATLGIPIHFTETTIVSGPRLGPGEKWGGTTAEGEQKQADKAAGFYTALFAHPAVQALTWWDFSDRGAWKGAPAGWLRKDMSPKPVYDRLLELIKGRWWTKLEGVTDSRGEFKARAFFGTHRVSAAPPRGPAAAAEVVLKREGSNRFEIVVQ